MREENILKASLILLNIVVQKHFIDYSIEDIEYTIKEALKMALLLANEI